ncbi:MAG TPA: amidohydrolase family protein, partial [Spirochaetota bacterium]
MIIDVHTHAFPDEIAPRALEALTKNSGDYKPVIGGTIDILLASMNEAGVDRSFVANIATKPEQSRAILSWSKKIASERIIPLGSVHPKSMNWEEEIDAIADSGLPGVKFHPHYQSFNVDDSRIYPLYEKLASRNLFALFHAGYDIAFPGAEEASPDRFVRVRKDIPSLEMIMAHVGGWRAWDRVAREIAGLDIYLDTSFIHELDQSHREDIFSLHSDELILFGSDSPWTSQKESVEMIRRLPISDERKERILGA